LECDINPEVPSSIHHNIGLWDFHGVSWVANGIIWPNVRTPLPYIKKKNIYMGGGMWGDKQTKEGYLANYDGKTLYIAIASMA